MQQAHRWNQIPQDKAPNQAFHGVRQKLLHFARRVRQRIFRIVHRGECCWLRASITAVRFAACRAVVSCGNYLIVFNYHGSVLTTKTGGSSCNGCRDRKVIFVFAYTLIHYKFSFAAFKPLLKTFRTEIVLKNGSESAFDFMRQIHCFSLTSRDRLGKKKFEMQQKWNVCGIHGKQRIFCLDYAIIKRNRRHTGKQIRKKMRHEKGDSE